MSNSIDFTGKSILVTGASSGIGKQVSIQCAVAGATVYLLGRDQDRLKQTLDTLEGQGHKIFCGDIKNEDFITETCNALPPLDGVVQSAGLMKLSPIKFLTPEIIDNIFSINLRAPILFTTTLVKLKKLKPYSSMVLLSSVTGAAIGCKGNSVYGATKGGIQAFCKSAALELAKSNIRVNCVAPGMVETEGVERIGEHVSDESIKADKKNYPLARYGTTKEVAAACLFLLSDASSWTTGTTLVIDGGFTAQ
jgi:NAD(P)-dependent dehydrogenase (short-subunit alcohol dehydrogenase family)